MNAFTSVRPRGVDAPSKQPRTGNASRAPIGTPLLRDSRGNLNVSLAPRVRGAITIESGAAAQASVDKRRAISPRGTK